jgi:huntingtin
MTQFVFSTSELAIYEEFTIEETLLYFGKIFRLDSRFLEKRIEFLLTFLDLPDKSRMVHNLR